MIEAVNPAEDASRQALQSVFACLDEGRSFRLEAGAGAGKTYSLVAALRFLIDRERLRLPRQHQQIACITFTNVAKDEIEARTDRSPLLYCDTVHAFCWSLISGFQKQLREQLAQLEPWQERLAEVGGLGERRVEYSLGYRGVRDHVVSIHHDDVLVLTIGLMANPKFRRIIADRYPIILIDEYQDTDAGWVAAIKEHFLGKPGSPLFGFFGDHWQKIYGNGCGALDDPGVTAIGKNANFRSVKAIVDCLNRMRPALPQFVEDPAKPGSVRLFHTNGFAGARQTGNHWGGDLPADTAHQALDTARIALTGEGWDFAPDKTKVLMLTHRVLANEQGYQSLPGVFRYNDAFTRKEHPHIAFFVDTLEPVCEAYGAKRYGEMFAALGGKLPAIRSLGDKEKWARAMDTLLQLRADGSVGDVIAHLRASHRPRLPDSVEQRERELEQFDRNAGEEMPDGLKEIEALHAVSFQEITALTKYLDGHSPFETKHGVKGAQFENVLVVVGRGWNLYNFNELLELSADVDHIPAKRQDAYERNRNLFYVACSRPKTRLALLFTQKLSDRALQTATTWFGADAIRDLPV